MKSLYVSAVPKIEAFLNKLLPEHDWPCMSPSNLLALSRLCAEGCALAS